MHNDTLCAFVLRRIREMGITRKEFVCRAGISRSCFYKIIGGQVGEVRIETLRKLARALAVNPIELFRMAVVPGGCVDRPDAPGPGGKGVG